MITALIAVIPLAIVDSINPSALAITAVILSQTNPTKRSLTYLFGVYVANYLLGIVLIYGISQLISPFISQLGGALYWAAIGAGFLVATTALFWHPSSHLPSSKHGHSARSYIGLFILGLVVTAYESPTALPYVAASTYLSHQTLSLPALSAILVVYNIFFVLPPLILILLNHIFGQAHHYLVNFKARFAQLYPPLIRIFIFILGISLFWIGLWGII